MNAYTILVILLLAIDIKCFKILVFYPIPSYSHQRAIMALTEELVRKGHELYVVSPNVVPGLRNNSNYTYVDVSFSYSYFSDEEKEGNVVLQQRISKWDLMEPFRTAAALVPKQFNSEPFLRFRKQVEDEEKQFDVVIMETFFIPFTCGMTRLIAKNAPIISMSSFPTDFAEENLGSIFHASFVPMVFGAYSDKMGLWQKIENWYSYQYLMLKLKDVVENDARAFFREHFDDESLACGCWDGASLSLISSSHLYFYPRLLGPNVIELGAMHIKPPEKLPKHLQAWLDGAEKGVIYFSLGSNMKSKSLPVEVRSNFLKYFRELPSGYRVLWKWELDGKIPGQSDNILAQKWLPQESVLAHPMVRVFVTQGGLQSFQETVHYGVPTVGIPWFGDQECNVAKMVDAEIGTQILPHELQSYKKIKTALDAVLYDERCSKNMKKLSAISRDFTSQALDKAVFWVEHVAKHGGASHLKPSTADTTYFQFFCLDIISVILALSFTCIYIFVLVFRYLISSTFFWRNFKVKKS